MASSGLYRSNRHSMIAGVMGGIAERFGWNVTLLRVIFVLISIMSAAFIILVYLVLWLVIPKKQPEHIEGYRQSVRAVNEEQVR